MTNSKRAPSLIVASTVGVGVIGGSMQLSRGLQLPACLKARGNRAIASTRAISSSPTTDAIMKRGCGDGEFGSTELQGVLSLAMSSLVTGIFGAFAEGLALYAASMAPELHYPTRDNEPPRQPRS
jgi:hypothetical protein